MDLEAAPPVPDAETCERMLDELAAFIANGGAGPFLGAPVEPSERAFPEPWKPTRAGVEVVLRRLLWHVNLDRVVVTEDHRSGAPPTERKPETRVGAKGIGDRKAVFVIEFVGSDDVVGTLAHEVGVVYAALARGEDAGPYREAALVPGGGGGGGGDSRDRNDLDEHPLRGSGRGLVHVQAQLDHERGSIASVYLGLGVVATNAAFQQYSQGGRFNGAYVPLEYDVLTAGYLPMSSLAYLLAVQAVVRRESEPPKGLSGPQRDEVSAWLAVLSPRVEELRERLGITDDDAPVERRDVVPYDDVELVDEEPPKRIAFRWRTHRGFVGLLAGATLGGGLALAVARHIAPIILTATGVTGHLVGRRVKVPRCTACSTVVGPTDESCGHCGADLKGDIVHLADRLDAEERYERDVRGLAVHDEPPEPVERDA